ncbi:SDR family NAD(P)-dependent oxidoreductase [Aquimarina sp. LLG6339-5]|uniref:SDR family NAD(P)-dependent oxidoreductase n=1 Tax=Aquimarina sp. LLG6339-5 TaxID=3160830 RepID=UPI00386496CF
MNKKSVKDKVVFITGVSSGLGKDLAELLLKEGAKVIATFRKESQAKSFEEKNEGNAIGIVVDIKDNKMIEQGVKRALDHFGKIDILANNAGVGALGAVEETTDEEARHIFDVNFFGGLSVIRAVLPIMRQQESGHILLFSALGGFHGVPGFGIYAAAKSATIVLGESLAGELAAFKIDVTVLTIGVFDTGMSTRVLFAKNELEAYKNTPVGGFKEFIRNIPGKEPNDPKKAAKAILNILKSDNPPLNTAIGPDALEGMRKRLSHINTEIKEWESNAISTIKDE